MLQSEVEVGNRLSFNALRCIYNEEGPFTSGDGSRDFVAEVDVSWRINQIKDVLLSIGRGIDHLNGVAFDGDPTLSFEVHIVEGLVLHLPFGDGSRGLEQPVGQGTFPMVNMCNNAEISDVFHRGRMFLKTTLQPHAF